MAKWYITNGILHCDEHLTVTEVNRYFPAASTRPFDFDENSTVLTVPSDVHEIAALTFSLCDKLETVTFNEGLESIGVGAFYGHKNIRCIAFPESLEWIDDMAFSAGITLEHSEVFDLLTAKYGTDADKPTVPCVEGDAHIGGTMLQSVTFGSRIRTIGDAAFFGCHNLKDVQKPETAKYIGASAFAPFNLLDVFEMCCSMDYTEDEPAEPFDLTVEKALPADRKWYITDGVLHCDCFISPIERSVEFAFSPELTSLELPESVCAVAPYTFRDCKKLRELTVSGSVRSLCREAFADCSSLERIVLKNGVRLLDDDCLRACHALKEITLPEQPVHIHPRALNCCVSERIEVKGCCNSLTYHTFTFCPRLRELILPADAVLPEQPFMGYNKLTVRHADR